MNKVTVFAMISMFTCIWFDNITGFKHWIISFFALICLIAVIMSFFFN